MLNNRKEPILKSMIQENVTEMKKHNTFTIKDYYIAESINKD